MPELTHWKKLNNPNFLGAYAFDIGEEKKVTIEQVGREVVTGEGGKKEDCTVVHLYGEKPLILNATNAKAITKLLGTPYIEEWAGRSIILRVQKVAAFGDVVDAVRVKPELPPPVLCEQCKKEIRPFQTMSPFRLAEYTKNKFGKCLCSECAKNASA